MTRWQAFRRSFHKNVIVKKKYKAFLHLVFDKEYRESVNRLHYLTRHCTKNEVKPIAVSMIIPGHKIVYPAYALGLFATMDDLPHIRVVLDPILNKYVVVDGNHRLPALIMRSRVSMYKDMLFCEVIS